MDDLDELLRLVERSAELAKRKTFVANVMETGTDAHRAIECGIRIGERFRAEVLDVFENLIGEGGT